MHICYTSDGIQEEELEKYSHSIFLAGPTPRSASVPSWRPEAIKILEELNYDGFVWSPEKKPDSDDWSYDTDECYHWEKWGLVNSEVVLFWVPRDMETMPAFTTNIEFGRWITKSAYGRPDDAPKNKYMDIMYKDIIKEDPSSTLKATIERALAIRYY